MEEVGSFRRGKSGWKCDVDRKAVDTPGGGYYLRLTVSLRSRYLWLVTGVMFQRRKGLTQREVSSDPTQDLIPVSAFKRDLLGPFLRHSVPRRQFNILLSGLFCRSPKVSRPVNAFRVEVTHNRILLLRGVVVVLDRPSSPQSIHLEVLLTQSLYPGTVCP